MLKTIELLESFKGSEIKLSNYTRTTENTSGESAFIKVSEIMVGIGFSEKKPNINIKTIQEGYVVISDEDKEALNLVSNELYCKQYKTYTLYKQGEKRMNITVDDKDIELEDQLKIENDEASIELMYNKLFKNLKVLKDLTAINKGVQATQLIQVFAYPNDEITAKYGVSKSLYNPPYIKVTERASKPKIKEAPVSHFVLKGVSNIPSYNAVIKKVDKGGKLNKYESLIHEYSQRKNTKEVADQIESDYDNAVFNYGVSYNALYIATNGKLDSGMQDEEGNTLLVK